MSLKTSNLKQCDLCGHADFELLATHDRRGRDLSTDICRHCGLVCHRQIPSDQELAEFYGTQYRRTYHGETTPSPRRVMRAWNNAGRIHRQLAPWLRQPSRVFEVGAGIGCTVRWFAERGHVAQGIEPNEGFQTFAANQLGAAVKRSSWAEIAPVPQYDLVILTHVIEHLRSPRAALTHLHDMLDKRGLLYVECPNLAAPFARPGRLFHFAHIFNFTPWTLRGLARSCGFEVVETFGDENNPNLQILLRRADSFQESEFLEADGYSRTLKAIERYTTLGYHLRWSYLAQRIAKLASYGWERCTAKACLRRLLQTAPSIQVGQNRQAA
jgi:SAM-dependent methyltransferase